MDDSRIIELYWQRNADAIRETDRKYGPYCFAIARNILSSREDSEECVNDTWMAAWNAMPPQKPGRLQMFLAKITRNLSFNRYNAHTAKKRGGGEIALVLDELAECLASESNVENSMRRRNLAHRSVSLSAACRNGTEMCLFDAISSRNPQHRSPVGTA